MKFEKTFGAIEGEPVVTYWLTVGRWRFAFTRFHQAVGDHVLSGDAGKRIIFERQVG